MQIYKLYLNNVIFSNIFGVTNFCFADFTCVNTSTNECD